MVISRQDFLNSLAKALPGIEKNNSVLAGADTFVFSGGFVHTYNDNMSVSSILSGEAKGLEGAVQAKDFYDLVNRFTESEIKIIEKDGKWILKCGNARVELTLLSTIAIDYVKKIHPQNIEWRKIPTKFFDCLKLSLFSGNKSPLSGIFIKNNIVVSTDEMRINWLSLDDDFGCSFWISDNAALEIMKITDLTQMVVADSWVHFLSADGTMLSCKKLQHGKYPIAKIEELISTVKKDASCISANLPKSLADAVNRAAALSINIESFSAVKLTFSNDGITVFSERPSGKYVEKVMWDSEIKKDFEDVFIYADYAMIEHGIRRSKSFYLNQSRVDEKMVTKIVFENDVGIQMIGTFDGK